MFHLPHSLKRATVRGNALSFPTTKPLPTVATSLHTFWIIDSTVAHILEFIEDVKLSLDSRINALRTGKY